MPTSPHGSPDRGLKPFILAIHREALETAAAKGLTGTLAQVAALQDTASLASAKAGRLVTEEEVMRLLLRERRARKIHEAMGTAPVVPVRKPVAAPSRFRLGRWRTVAMGMALSASAGLAGKARL
ncbi:hypothetical protein Sp245p_34220 (plasmid) [Azospirillum baldaniorum]|uniref:Uncharacterized protein n=1 Tax=Azospirillum baldaniorum TaxID=1064539 RepID=A0A9P1K0I0_9PROT|nr:hypothetical protein [Azospirillum baldaniorum]AWJ94862.1 hypothetical protein Sp245p_34220 [Azospirillum baldaniorum]NUB10953.1 hypothetical protein [Azospirillum baldaniorum]TWA74949.1 hypothetical protein FBZ85_1132 [Azospirillum brasilense]CCD03293.1 conserved protein of unknown function [Azospirillum baldaniorum]